MGRPALHHLAFRTRDVDALVSFYRDVVGLAEREGGSAGRSTWLSLGDAIVMIERAEEGEARPDPASMELLAFYIDPEALASARSRLARRGVIVEGSTRFTIYFRDPDGRRLAFSHYPEEPCP